MIFEPETVKGFRDYLPPESAKRNKIKEIVRKYYKLYGFLPVETPMIELDELMRSNTLEEEDEAVSERFRLKDKGRRNLGLRYEFTFQLGRIFKKNPNIKLPFRKYQIGENFRDEPIRTGRTRQFTMCDADIIGDSSPTADAECISLVTDILKELKIKNFEIQVNNRKILDEIIRSVRIKETKKVMKELDKIEKIGEDNVKINLKKYADSGQIITLFRLLGKDLNFFKENLFAGSEELDELIKLCKLYGVKIKFNPFMIRGFNYYTGSIFEFMVGKTAIAAGGRYDNLVGRYIERKIPAVGISFSLESLMSLCEKELSELKTDYIPQTLILSLSQDKEAIKLAKTFRKSNISCISMFGKPGKSLEFANSQKIPYVIFIGSEEMEKKKFKLKEMSTGKEKLMNEKQLVTKLSKK
ncbi:histidine--tRNA ligase [Candidatus Parvarchaeota archaeon]|jgi:histidyl-tRNA synthetase|nr:MAG: histidine--tRNA ligase [Candidatus Parvarchaeota archaeon]PXY71588.1 MAG: histidine--tRNA ligase [Candidatus Parvarchaeota archaeon]